METFILNLLESISNIDFGFVWQIFLYSLVLFWIVVVYWVWLDSGERTSNEKVRVLYVFLVILLNVVGWIIYLIIRPSQTIEEVYWSDLERRYLKYETAELGDCPKCGTQLYPGYTHCPNCRYRLKVKCSRCDVYIDRKNKYCPYCGNEMRQRSSGKEESPTKEVMEKQIKATREEATEVVETKKTRYTIQKGFAVKIGDLVINGYNNVKEFVQGTVSSIGDFLKDKLQKKGSDTKNVKGKDRKVPVSKKKGKKKNKKKSK